MNHPLQQPTQPPGNPASSDPLPDEDQLDLVFRSFSQLGETSIEPGNAESALAPLGVLPPFLRALLVTDGTVTLALEACFAEPVQILTRWQKRYNAPFDIPALAISAGEPAFLRNVHLLGSKTGTCYAHATSLMNPARIKPALFDKLVDERAGIGVILRNDARGSFREVLRVQRGNILSDFAVNRTYRVSLDGLPALLITEEFPLAPFT